tara:strand:- start:38 stop:1051 length:1014 start_codon:yes stop_codon:yes gene_type:complete
LKIIAYRVFLFIIVICPLRGTNIGGLSFLNIPTSAVSSYLGNTMAAEMGFPSALVQNPANIWQHQKLKLSFLHREDTIKELGAEYNNVFLGWNFNYIKKVSFALGLIRYDISKIERYDELANFLGYFKYTNWAVLGGLSLKGSGMQGGVGFSYINQFFTNIGYEKEHFFGIDLGFNMDQVQKTFFPSLTKLPELNLSLVIKTVFSQTGDPVRTASTNSIVGIQVVQKWPNSFSVLWNTDYLSQSGSDMGFVRLGTQAKWLPNKNFGIGFGGGYNRFPVNSLKGTTDGDLRKYSGKWSFGLTLELNKIAKLIDLEIGYSYEIHPVQLDSQYISFRFSL